MATHAQGPWAVVGTFVHAPIYGELEIAEERCLLINGHGVIDAICPASEAEPLLAEHGVGSTNVLRLRVRPCAIEVYAGQLANSCERAITYKHRLQCVELLASLQVPTAARLWLCRRVSSWHRG